MAAVNWREGIAYGMSLPWWHRLIGSAFSEKDFYFTELSSQLIWQKSYLSPVALLRPVVSLLSFVWIWPIFSAKLMLLALSLQWAESGERWTMTSVLLSPSEIWQFPFVLCVFVFLLCWQNRFNQFIKVANCRSNEVEDFDIYHDWPENYSCKCRTQGQMQKKTGLKV